MGLRPLEMCFNSFSAGIVFIRQNLTSTDVRFWRIKTVPALKGSIYISTSLANYTFSTPKWHQTCALNLHFNFYMTHIVRLKGNHSRTITQYDQWLLSWEIPRQLQFWNRKLVLTPTIYSDYKFFDWLLANVGYKPLSTVNEHCVICWLGVQLSAEQCFCGVNNTLICQSLCLPRPPQ